MATAKEQFTASVDPDLLATMRKVARAEGKDFDSAIEDAMRDYVAAWERRHTGVRPEVMAHYRDSLERNRKLMELLAQAERRK